MNQKLFNVLMFATGAAIGSLVTWKVVKTKYERIAQEEIDSVKETWARWRHEDNDDSDEYDVYDEEESEENEYDESTQVTYRNLASEYGREGEGDEEVPIANGPYVIKPEDYADGNYDHDLYCLTYYSDGVLANDWYEKFDVEDTIGEDAIEHFGDYTEDVVHVRNEQTEADYEVVRDSRRYVDVVAALAPNHAYAD